MRIAVIADTHLPHRGRRLPQRLLDECAAADLILHAGDLTELAVLVELELYGEVHAVRGNCDADDLRRLPVERVVEAKGARIGMIHDAGPTAGRAERLERRFVRCGAVVFGHSHAPTIERHGALLLLNPGSASERRRAPSCTMARLEVKEGRLEAELIELP